MNAYRRLRHTLSPYKRALWAQRHPIHARDERDNRHMAMTMAFTLSPTSNTIDVGAAHGHQLQHLVRLAPDGHHLAIEALPEQAEKLRVNYPGVEVVNAAASSSPGRASFSRSTVIERSGLEAQRREWDRVEAPAVDTFEVEVVTIDGLVAGGRKIDLIKIDVEGAEVEVLKGAAATIRESRPVILVEHGPAEDQDGQRSTELLDVAADLGLRVFDIDGGGPHTAESFRTAFAGTEIVPPLWNWVLVPA